MHSELNTVLHTPNAVSASPVSFRGYNSTDTAVY